MRITNDTKVPLWWVTSAVALSVTAMSGVGALLLRMESRLTRIETRLEALGRESWHAAKLTAGETYTYKVETGAKK